MFYELVKRSNIRSMMYILTQAHVKTFTPKKTYTPLKNGTICT